MDHLNIKGKSKFNPKPMSKKTFEQWKQRYADIYPDGIDDEELMERLNCYVIPE